jgi:Fe-S-cluster containining protein
MSVALAVLTNSERLSQHCTQECKSACCERIYHQRTLLIRGGSDKLTDFIDNTLDEAMSETRAAFGEILACEGYVLPNTSDIDIYGNSMYVRLTVAFTCNRFDHERRLCADYENRPTICRTAKCTEIANCPTFSVHGVRSMHERVSQSSIVDRDTALHTMESLFAAGKRPTPQTPSACS